MKKSLLFFAAIGALFLCGCGGGKAAPKVPVSNVKERVFVSNENAGVLNIVNASVDQLSTFVVGGLTGPTQMFESADKGNTIVYNSFSNSFSVVTNSSEAVTGTVGLPGAATSIVVTSDGTRGFVALPNNSCKNSSVTGSVAVINFTNGTITNCITVAGVRQVALSNNGATLLMFTGGSNVAMFMDTTALTPTAINPSGNILDNPIGAVFSSDDSTAYILSCGAECGGSTASVTLWTTKTNTLGTQQVLPAAREALLNSGTLYVAGSSPSTPGAGQLNVLNASTLAPSAPQATIADGSHDTILLTNGQLFVGARTCSDVSTGCLSIFNTSSGKVVFSAVNPNGNSTNGGDDVTGITPIPGRNVVYVCEGGELRIYDTTTDALQSAQVDIVGSAQDAVEVF